MVMPCKVIGAIVKEIALVPKGSHTLALVCIVHALLGDLPFAAKWLTIPMLCQARAYLSDVVLFCSKLIINRLR